MRNVLNFWAGLASAGFAIFAYSINYDFPFIAFTILAILNLIVYIIGEMIQ